MGKNDQEYEVDAIIGKRRKKMSGSVEYRVLWKGYPKEQATWEPEQHLDNVQYMIDDFNNKIQQRSQGPKNTPPSTQAQVVQQTKKPIDETITSNQEPKKKQLPPKSPARKSMKQSDSNEDEDENEDSQTLETKPVPISLNKNRSVSNQIQEQPKVIQKKVLPPVIEKKVFQPVRNGVKPTISEVQQNIKRQLPHKQEIEKKTDIEQEEGFSSDEEQYEPNIEVTGMCLNENGKYGFAVYERTNKRRVILRRREIIKRDPIALVKFYEKFLNATTS